MNIFKTSIQFGAALLFVLGIGTGCETNDNGGTTYNHNYYGSGFHDPWYYGDYDHDHHHDHDDVIVIPPPSGNRPDNGLRPAHPIARPPAVRPPRPSIPTAPRPASRGGGGRGRR